MDGTDIGPNTPMVQEVTKEGSLFSSLLRNPILLLSIRFCIGIGAIIRIGMYMIRTTLMLFLLNPDKSTLYLLHLVSLRILMRQRRTPTRPSQIIARWLPTLGILYRRQTKNKSEFSNMKSITNNVSNPFVGV